MIRICLITSIWSADYLESITKGIRAQISADKDIRVDAYVGFDINEWGGVSLQKEGDFYGIIEPDMYDGILVAIGGYNLQKPGMEAARRFMELGKPIVTIESPIEGAPMVKADNYNSFYHITEHIVRDHKCTKLNFVGGPKDARDATTRYKAFMDCCSDYGIRPGDISYKYYFYSFEDGKQAYYDFKAEGKHLPDAVICANDAMARGYLEAAYEDGFRAPESFLITGFDNDLQSRRYIPSITTVDVNLSDSAKTATKMLLDAINNGTKIPMNTVTVEKICRMQSCGCVPINSFSEDKILALHKAQDVYDNRNLSSRIALQGISRCSSIEDLKNTFEYYVDNINTKRAGIALNNGVVSGVFETDYDEYDDELVMVTTEGIYNINRHKRIYPEYIDTCDDSQIIMICPIYFEKSTLGYGCFALNDEIFASMERRAVSGYLGVAIETLRQKIALNTMNDEIQKINRQLRELSTTDTLTGLYNRLAYAQLGENYYERNKGNVFFLYIDMDRLKYINDNCGHNVGNVAIKGISEGIRQFFDEDTLRFRMGGDEFLVIGVPESEEKLQKTISDLEEWLGNFGRENNLPIPLTASMGYVLSKDNDHPLTFEEMVNKSDSKMYEIKMEKKRV
ncbi:MAG: GGDEF domain-containing protein [Lachnospiraceae bacterium]|nr:GGDEF domain-containing protein [Lachnospiraceae bacterium]